MITILEAYYGAGVVLDYDPASKEEALRVALETVARAEERPLADVVVRRVQDDVVVPSLSEVMTPLWRYYDFEVTLGGGRPYLFVHLAEGGTGFSFGPAWQAPDAFYDAFWAHLDEVMRALGHNRKP